MSCLFLLDVYGRDRKRLCESWRDRELCVCLLLELLGSKQQQQQQQQPFNQKLNLIKNVDKVSGEKYIANDEILILLNRFPFYFSFYVMISPPLSPIQFAFHYNNGHQTKVEVEMNMNKNHQLFRFRSK